MVSKWFLSGFRLVSEWFLSGFRVVSEWFQSGFRVVSEWVGVVYNSLFFILNSSQPFWTLDQTYNNTPGTRVVPGRKDTRKTAPEG